MISFATKKKMKTFFLKLKVFIQSNSWWLKNPQQLARIQRSRIGNNHPIQLAIFKISKLTKSSLQIDTTPASDEIPSKFKSQIIGKLFKCSHESIKIVLLEIYFVSELKISFEFPKTFGKQNKQNSIWKAYVMNF